MEWLLKNGERKDTAKIYARKIVYNDDKRIEYEKQQMVFHFVSNHRCRMFAVEFWLEPLNMDWLIDETEKYKSADGMYCYCGSFCSREYIMEEMRQNRRVLNAKFDYIEVDE